MNHISVCLLIARISDTYGFKDNCLLPMGRTGLLVRGIVHEVSKPVFAMPQNTFEHYYLKMARGNVSSSDSFIDTPEYTLIKLPFLASWVKLGRVENYQVPSLDTELFTAFMSGEDKCDPEYVQLLIDNGAKLKVVLNSAMNDLFTMRYKVPTELHNGNQNVFTTNITDPDMIMSVNVDWLKGITKVFIRDVGEVSVLIGNDEPPKKNHHPIYRDQLA